MNTPTEEPQITVRQFLDDIMRFRDQLGQKSFWQLPEDTHTRALIGLTHQFSRMEGTDEEIRKAIVSMKSVTDEYLMRSAYITSNPKVLK